MNLSSAELAKRVVKVTCVEHLNVKQSNDYIFEIRYYLNNLMECLFKKAHLF